jgi:hypothetical protein
MGGLGSGAESGRTQVVQRAQCQFCPADHPPVTGRHYRKHLVYLKRHAYSTGGKEPVRHRSIYQCRHCPTQNYTPHGAMDHLIASHLDLLGPVRGWERVLKHVAPVAEPTVMVADSTTETFIADLVTANANLRAGMADLVDGWAKLEAEVKELKEAPPRQPAKLEGLAARLFKGWSERGADAFYDEREEISR